MPKMEFGISARHATFFCLLVVIAAGCKMTEVSHQPVTPDGIPVGGSSLCCPAEENRGFVRPVGSVLLSQYGPSAVCQDEWADKVVPWSTGPDCTGEETVLERLIGRRRLGHALPLLGWFGIGRYSEMGQYRVERTWQNERLIIDSATAYFTVKDSITIDGVRFADDDVIAFDGYGVAKLIDGGDIGTNKLEIDAFAVLAEGEFLVSFASDFEVDDEHLLPGLSGMIRDEDILLFEASSLGEATRGVFTLFIDGSDIGLGDTDIDALAVLDDESLVCSVDRHAKLGTLNVEPGDLLRLKVLQSGVDTHATWSVLMSAKDVGLEGQNIDAVDHDGNGNWYVSTDASFIRDGIVFDRADAFGLTSPEVGQDIGTPILIDHSAAFSTKGTTLEGNDITSVTIVRRD